MSQLASLLAPCPVHGPTRFVRDEQRAWWFCPAGDDCRAVVLDEEFDRNPDGGDVVIWSMSLRLVP